MCCDAKNPQALMDGQLGCRATPLSRVAKPRQLHRDGAEVLVRLYDSWVDLPTSPVPCYGFWIVLLLWCPAAQP